MRGYGQFCPIAMAAEIFAERWTPLILRELLYGTHHFNELRRGLPLISQSLLAQRLKSLEQAGVIESRRGPGGRALAYHLTPAGEALGPVVERLGDWGYRWTRARLRDEHLDPGVLMWFLHRLVNVDRLPPRRVVARFELHGGRHSLWWLILNRPEVDLCLRDEGFEVDLYVRGEVRVLVDAIMGHRDLKQAIREGLVELDGPRALVRAFPEWIGVSPFAADRRPIPVADNP
jgi:DNA-binding HxlR family transcriptional regulator